MKPLQLNLFYFFIVCVFLQACGGPGKPGYWADDKIPAGKREELHNLNSKIFDYLTKGYTKDLNLLLSKELVANTSTIRTLQHVRNNLRENDYSIFKEYYVINKWRQTDTIVSSPGEKNAYSLFYPGTEKEMYIAMLLPKKGINKSMITEVYCKFNYGWNLDEITVGDYTINDMTAPELYKLAQEKLKKNYLSDAVTIMNLESKCVQPNDMWNYSNYEEMSKFYSMVTDMANNKFKTPIVINQVSGSPRIFRISNEKMSFGSYPMIYYQTKISLKDTDAIKKENMNIRKVIGTIIPGIDKEKKYLIYTAFNQMPTIKVSVDRFEMIDKLQ